jgi:hypothetical protein
VLNPYKSSRNLDFGLMSAVKEISIGLLKAIA